MSRTICGGMWGYEQLSKPWPRIESDTSGILRPFFDVHSESRNCGCLRCLRRLRVDISWYFCHTGSIARAWSRSDPSGAPIHSPTGLSTGRPTGARIIRRFSPAGKGSIQKLRMHNFRRKRSIVQKQKLMITAVSRHIYILYIYI